MEATVEIKKGSFITKEQLINAGWKHLLNYGGLQVWATEGEVKFLLPR